MIIDINNTDLTFDNIYKILECKRSDDPFIIIDSKNKIGNQLLQKKYNPDILNNVVIVGSENMIIKFNIDVIRSNGVLITDAIDPETGLDHLKLSLCFNIDSINLKTFQDAKQENLFKYINFNNITSSTKDTNLFHRKIRESVEKYLINNKLDVNQSNGESLFNFYLKLHNAKKVSTRKFYDTIDAMLIQNKMDNIKSIINKYQEIDSLVNSN